MYIIFDLTCNQFNAQPLHGYWYNTNNIYGFSCRFPTNRKKRYISLPCIVCQKRKFLMPPRFPFLYNLQTTEIANLSDNVGILSPFATATWISPWRIFSKACRIIYLSMQDISISSDLCPPVNRLPSISYNHQSEHRRPFV